MSIPENEKYCCPPFDPTIWDDKIHEWIDKPFILGKVFTFLFVPVNFGQVIARLTKVIETAKGSVPDWLCLSDHTSKWNMDIYLAVDKEIPSAINKTISGKFYSRIYEGGFKDTGKWYDDFETNAKDKGLKISKMYTWYTTCPRCAKKYGKNYVVIISNIK